MAVGILIGAAVGIAEFLMTGRITKILIGGEKCTAKAIIYIIVKLILYAGAAALLLSVMKDRLIPAAIGYGAGMIISAFVNFAVEAGRK